jgi:hypothetical protein
MEVRLGERPHHFVAGGQEVAGEALDLRLVQLAAEVGEVDAHRGILAGIFSFTLRTLMSS